MTAVKIEFPARSSSGIPILALGVIALFAGLYQKNPALLALACVFCSAPLLTWFLVRRSARGIRLRRSSPGAVFEGDSIDVSLELTNNSGQAYFYPQVCEVFAPEIHAQKSIAFSGRLIRGESARQAYSGECVLPRGIYPLGPAAIRLCDPLGWFEANRLMRSQDSLKLYPRIGNFDLDQDLGRCVGAIVSDRHDPRVGLSSEFRSVREYRPGDSPRRVHWGLSARRGQPVVREFSAPSLGERTIFLDSYSEARVGWGRGSSVESEVKLAGAVIRRSLGQGRQTRLASSTEDSSTTMTEGSTRSDLVRFLDELVSFRTSSDADPMTDFLTRIGSRVPVGGTEVLMMHPYLFSNVALDGWLATRRRLGSRVIVILFEGRAPDEPLNASVETTAYQVARRLARFGLETHVIHAGDPIEVGIPEWGSESESAIDLSTSSATGFSEAPPAEAPPVVVPSAEASSPGAPPSETPPSDTESRE